MALKVRKLNFLRRPVLLTKEEVAWTLEGLAGHIKKRSARISVEKTLQGTKNKYGEIIWATVEVVQARDDGAWNRQVVVEVETKGKGLRDFFGDKFVIDDICIGEEGEKRQR